ncbi:MAG: hypothetical protein MUC48_20665 [Leptolyngbya sp. Prado105]|nr:hypothetical protein [Leptolyngbya sp. Prado105]
MSVLNPLDLEFSICALRYSLNRSTLMYQESELSALGVQQYIAKPITPDKGSASVAHTGRAEPND